MTSEPIKLDPETRRFERKVLLLVALVQFINIWDFMLVMPLGPDFSRALGISIEHLGWIAGSYSIAASIVGVLASQFLDRFDRRSVLLFCLSGMSITTLSMCFATSIYHLITLRVLTGAFGGPVIASSMAIIADIFPDNRRGEAVGKVFGSFSLAAVLGVPLSLEIAHYFDWWAPFVAVSAVAAVTVIIIRIHLPPMRRHIDERDHTLPPFSVLAGLKQHPAMRYACLVIASSSFAAFLIIPNISAFVQQNMGYPRQWLGFLYFCGGSAAFFSMRFIGKKSDQFGYARTSLMATGILWACIWLWFDVEYMAIPAALYFIIFMMGMSTRNVTSNALISKIPKAHERAGFMSLISSVQHLMSGVGATCSTLLLVENSDMKLEGMDSLAHLSMAVFIIMPWMMFKIERLIQARSHPLHNNHDQSHNRF
jgi:predicted MFS family arabinose efflux permease